MITQLQSLALGIIEGFTEFLPISSTAHLVLGASLLNIPQSNFVKTFEIAIQSGAVLAVVFFYFKKLLEWNMLKKIAVAFMPTGIIGMLLYTFVKSYVLGNIVVVLWSLAVGGVLLIIFEYAHKEKMAADAVEHISYRQAVYIGFFQSLAIVPGVSRAAATIVGGMLVGISRKTIVEFSFLLAVPTMLAATALDLLNSYRQFTAAQFDTLAIGFFASFVTAMASIIFLLRYIRRHSFVGFGVYRILLVLAFTLAVL